MIESEKNYRPDNRSDEAYGIRVLVKAHRDADILGNQCTRDANQRCDNKATRVASRHQQLRNQAYKESNNDSPKNMHKQISTFSLLPCGQLDMGTQPASAYPLPALLLLDLHMPRVDGFDLLAWLQRQGVFDSLPTVVLSAVELIIHVGHRAVVGGLADGDDRRVCQGGNTPRSTP